MYGLLFDNKDKENFSYLFATMKNNRRSAELFSAYLNRVPELVEKKLVEEMKEECGISGEKAVSAILSVAFGIDSENNPSEREFERRYVDNSVHILDINDYAWNEYYKRIKIPSAKMEKWELTKLKYKSYEGFVFRESRVMRDYSVIPQIGFFEEEFSFPAVLENGREWMAIKPNEIETMKEPLSQVEGRVTTFGLGMGYFAYMASQKANVYSVTIVERDPSVIKLFEKYILPQFEFKDKIKIVLSDGFKYLDNCSDLDADYVFADMWHDASDGMPMYLKLKKYEMKFKNTKFLYWIENTLKSYIIDAQMFKDAERIASSSRGASVYAKVIKGFEAYLDFLENELISYLTENE